MAAAVVAAAWTRAYRPPDGEPLPVRTSDGWTLWVYRYPPVGPPRGGPPVILGHGLMMNRWCWSLSEAGSLPRALAALGHDVFVAEYRGAGSSDGPRQALRRPGGLDGWGFDDHVAYDLPAIIEAVCDHTGASSVHWVGHSMGGMAGYAYALSTGGARLASLVTLGAPTRFEHVARLFGPTGPLAVRALRRMNTLRIRPLLRMVLPITLLAPELSMRTSGTSRFLSAGERLMLLSEAFEDSSPALAGYFIDLWANDKRLIPGGEAGLSFSDLSVPTLVVAGQGDVLAPPRSARVPFDETEPGQVAYVLFGDPEQPAEVAGPPFGHADLISGAIAMQHVLPLIAAWLDEPVPAAIHRPARPPREALAAEAV